MPTLAPPGRAGLECWFHPVPWVELFALSNIAFLAVDIFIAHSVNAFERPVEWLPVVFSLAAAPVLALAMLIEGLSPSTSPRAQGGEVVRRRLARWVGLVIGGAAIVVGVAGLLLHLDSQFFASQTLKNLVYTAPFAAPLSYTGLGLLIVLDRMVDGRSLEWARWVVLLALGGFVGNFVLSLADHAQNGFFHTAEWVAVGSAAFAIGALVAAFLIHDNRPLLWLCAGVMLVQVAVGALGAYDHARGNLATPVGSLREKFLYGAPVFAPLLFADLAVLALLGLWALALQQPQTGD
jgi:hypothetical protein